MNLKSLLFTVIIFISSISISQVGGNGVGPNGVGAPGQNKKNNVPINTGIIVLLIVGTIYGASKIKRND